MKLLTRLKLSLSSPTRKRFFNLLVFFASFLWFNNFARAVFVPHFFNQGLSIRQIITGSAMSFFGSSLTLFLLKKIPSRLSWRLALITFVIFTLGVIKINSPQQFYLASLFGSLPTIFFFLAYNIAHFKLTPQHHTGFSASIMFSVSPIISLVTPLLAGFIAENSYNLVWLLSGLFFLIAFSQVKRQPGFTIEIDLKKRFQSIKALRLFLILEGLWEPVILVLIPVFALHFVQTPLYYGTYLAYLSLMAILANLFLGRLSDKLQKRILFLYPITIIMALATFIFPLATKTLAYWLIITGLIQFLTPLFHNFSTAMFVDAYPNVRKSIPIREFLLQFGRFIGTLAIVINFQFQTQPTYIFYIFGSIMLFFPLVLFYNSRISRKYSYL